MTKPDKPSPKDGKPQNNKKIKYGAQTRDIINTLKAVRHPVRRKTGEDPMLITVSRR